MNGVQTVAVKIYCDQLSVSAKAGPLAEACRREIFLLRSCHDRNIVQCAPRCADPSAPAPRGRPRSAAAHSARRRAPSAAVPRPAALAVARPARALSAAPLPAPTPGGVRVARGGGLERRASPTLTLTLTLTCSRAQVCWRLPCRGPECWSPSSWTTATCSASLPRVTLTLVLHNVRRFVGACLQEGQTVLVTEYMENGDLFRALAEDAGGRFGWYRRAGPSGRPAPNTGLARRVALDVARGLFFLHDKKARPARTLHPKSCGSGGGRAGRAACCRARPAGSPAAPLTAGLGHRRALGQEGTACTDPAASEAGIKVAGHALAAGGLWAALLAVRQVCRQAHGQGAGSRARPRRPLRSGAERAVRQGALCRHGGIAGRDSSKHSTEASGGWRRAGGGCREGEGRAEAACGRADHPAGPEVAQRAARAGLDGQDCGLWRRQDPAHRLPDHAQGHGHVRLGRAGGAAGQAVHREGAPRGAPPP